jgi:hypothetical protein
LPHLPEHGDIVDWIVGHGNEVEAEGLRHKIEAMVDDAEPIAIQPLATSTDRFISVHVLPEPVRSFVKAGAMAIDCDTSYLALPTSGCESNGSPPAGAGGIVRGSSLPVVGNSD